MPNLSESYNLYVLRPDLVKEWHPTKNGSLTPEAVTPESMRKVWWLCEQGHWWLAAIRDRVKGMKCTYCSRSLRKADQRIIDLKPGLLKEWHPTRNAGLIARNVSSDYEGEVWWICEQGHEWKATVPCRIAGKGCPFCSKLIPDASSVGNLNISSTPHPESEHTRCTSLQQDNTVIDSGTDWRRNRRYIRSVVVMLEQPSSGVLGYAELHNFSAGGMMLRSNFAIRPGEIIRVRLDKPLYTSASNLMTSKVVWCRDLNDQDDTVTRFGIGVSLG